MFKRVADEVGAITRGMREVEEAVELRGRKYYGAFDASTAFASSFANDDDPQAIGLEVGSLPGGRHALQRLTGEPHEVYERIGPTFQRLSERPDRDPSRSEARGLCPVKTGTPTGLGLSPRESLVHRIGPSLSATSSARTARQRHHDRASGSRTAGRAEELDATGQLANEVREALDAALARSPNQDSTLVAP